MHLSRRKSRHASTLRSLCRRRLPSGGYCGLRLRLRERERRPRGERERGDRERDAERVGDGEGERRRLRGGSGGEEVGSGPAAAAAGLVASGLELGISAEAIVAWGGSLVWRGRRRHVLLRQDGGDLGYKDCLGVRILILFILIN